MDFFHFQDYNLVPLIIFHVWHLSSWVEVPTPDP